VTRATRSRDFRAGPAAGRAIAPEWAFARGGGILHRRAPGISRDGCARQLSLLPGRRDQLCRPGEGGSARRLRLGVAPLWRRERGGGRRYGEWCSPASEGRHRRLDHRGGGAGRGGLEASRVDLYRHRGRWRYDTSFRMDRRPLGQPASLGDRRPEYPRRHSLDAPPPRPQTHRPPILGGRIPVHRCPKGPGPAGPIPAHRIRAHLCPARWCRRTLCPRDRSTYPAARPRA